MSRRILISGYYGYDNFGDEAILGVLVDHLRRLNPDSDITVLSKSPFKTSRTYGVKSVKNFSLLGVLAAVSSCDVLVSGGGSLLQDITSLKSLLYYCFIISLAQLMHKEVIIFAQGIGPLTRNFSKKLVFDLLRKCHVITVRDLKSQMYLQNNGIQADLVSDPVFSVDFPTGEQEEVVGVQLRAFRSIDDAFLFTLARQVVTYFGDKLIEMYVFQESLDYDICKKFEKMLKTISPGIKTKIIHNISGNDMILKISRLQYMIAMRFHAVLVAIKSGVKTLAINYDAKVEKLAYDAFLPLLTISIDEDMDPPFERLLQLDSNTLLDYCANQTFEWEYFDDFFV